MPIQFRCAHCSKPIEVDDEFAGQSATCPYCSQVTPVPAAGEPASHPVLPARPMAAADAGRSPPPLPSFEPAGYGPPPLPGVPERSRGGGVMGAWGLACAVLSAGLFVGAMLLMMRFADQVGLDLAAELTPAERRAAQQEIEKKVESDPGLALPALGSAACAFGGAILGVVGLALGVAAILRGGSRVVTGWLAVVGSGLTLTCVCGVMVMGLLGMASG